MNFLYVENYVILAAFLVFFLLEVGIAIISLFDFKIYTSKFKDYLLPLWEIDGTFAIFYVVNLEATYPGALQLVGTVYVVPMLVGGIFLVARNAFLAYSELAKVPKEEKGFLNTYALSTIVIGFIAIMALSSGITGAGVNIKSDTLNLLALFTQPFGFGLFITAALLALSAVALCFDIRRLRKAAFSFMLLAIAIALLDAYIFAPSLVDNVLHDIYAIPIAFTLVVIIFLVSRHWPDLAKYFVVPFFIVLIAIFGMLQYPYLLGGAVTYPSLMTNTAEGAYVALFTTAGSIVLVIFLGVLFYLFHKK